MRFPSESCSIFLNLQQCTNSSWDNPMCDVPDAPSRGGVNFCNPVCGAGLLYVHPPPECFHACSLFWVARTPYTLKDDWGNNGSAHGRSKRHVSRVCDRCCIIPPFTRNPSLPGYSVLLVPGYNAPLTSCRSKRCQPQRQRPMNVTSLIPARANRAAVSVTKRM